MDFALMTEPQMGGNYSQLLRLAQWSEENGLVAFARSDHYYSSSEPSQEATDAFATLAGMARETDSIKLTVLVSPLTFRHPSVIAKNASTIDQMSGGRFELGIGTGWMDEEHDAFGLELWPMAERFQRLAESMEYLRAFFGPQPARFKGDFYRIDADVKPGPAGPMPLIIGGTGRKKTPALAGRFADEYNQSPRPVEVLAENIETMKTAAAAAGRQPEAITCSVMGSVVVGSDDSTYRRRLEETAAKRGMSPDDLETNLSAGGMPIGGADRARELMAQWEAAGVSRFYMRQMELTDFDLLADRLAGLGAL
jgi:alkanesulfonate monooxygenase SsuD/methylene tetrahydromethanopterin reductase-like flavin-dependent oxidoreductase (luciferase family)